MQGSIFEVNEADFQARVLDAATPVLVDFWAEWCGPCRMIAPIVDDIATEYAGRIQVAKMDADMNQNVLMNLGIMGIPTLILFKDGEEVERIIGMQSRDRIMNKIAEHFVAADDTTEAVAAEPAAPAAENDSAVEPSTENENIEA